MILFYKKELATAISSVYSFLDEKDIVNLIGTPPKKELGDFAFPCFSLSKHLKKSPKIIASNFVLANKEVKSKHFSKIESDGPYINFFLKRSSFIKEVLKWSISLDKSAFLHIGKGKKILIDFSSPNIAKPFSVAHLRSTSIGNSLYKIFSFVGYDVVRINHLGDWGTSFGKLISAYLRWGSEEDLKSEPIKKLLKLYIRFHKEAKEDKELVAEGRFYFKELERGESTALSIWSSFRTLSLAEFKRIYKMLNVSFDYYSGESFYKDKIASVLDIIENKKLSKISEGALVIELEGEKVPFLLKKQDGASLYGTRDIAAALYRKQEFSFDKMLYVVGSEQSLYFRQLFKVLSLISPVDNSSCEHIKFGLMHFKEGKMSTREGKVIFLEDLINKARDKALEKLNESLDLREGDNGFSDSDKEELALNIGISSIIFFDLKTNRLKDCMFDWDDVLNPKGETGIYLQYAHARLCGIVRNFKKVFGDLPSLEDFSISDDSSFDLAYELSLFKSSVESSASDRDPSIISRFLLALSKSFSSYYKKHKVVNESNKALSMERIQSVIAMRKVLCYGMELLGLKPLERL